MITACTFLSSRSQPKRLNAIAQPEHFANPKSLRRQSSFCLLSPEHSKTHRKGWVFKWWVAIFDGAQVIRTRTEISLLIRQLTGKEQPKQPKRYSTHKLRIFCVVFLFLLNLFLGRKVRQGTFGCNDFRSCSFFKL